MFMTRRLTTTIALIVRLASSTSTGLSVHGLTTLLLNTTQTNGVLDALHGLWESVRIVENASYSGFRAAKRLAANVRASL